MQVQPMPNDELETGKKSVDIRSSQLTFAKLMHAYRKSVLNTTSRSSQKVWVWDNEDYFRMVLSWGD